MFYYKDELELNNKFNKSTNIIYDNEDCEGYIVTQSTKDTLKTFFKRDYHNSIALIGPFGSGKSSLLLYINTLLADNENTSNCLSTLKYNDIDLYNQCKLFKEKKTFIRIKIVGEHISFKSQFKNIISNHKLLKLTKKYLIENPIFQISKALELIDKDLQKSQFSDILFSIDEFGKFIEYSSEHTDDNDIFDLQTLSEYINKKKNYKLIISLHKAFSDYISSLNISYTDWDKIQGRFENIVFKDDYYEMLNIFKETISLSQSQPIQNAQDIVSDICNANLPLVLDIDIFKQITPIHPFSAIVISEIFTRYFQNQRSVFSFLFSTEPYAFQEFIEEERTYATLYTLSHLYDYVSYLLKVYSITLPDKEMWYISSNKLKDFRLNSDLEKDIIKTISLIHTFKLSKTILTNNEYIVLSLKDKYTENEITNTIDKLIQYSILVFQEQTQSFSLIEDSNININKELKERLSNNKNINLESKLNLNIFNKFLIAKRYFITYGSQKSFEKIFVLNSEKVFKDKYKVFFSNQDKQYIGKQSLKYKTSIFIPIDNMDNIFTLIKKIDVLEDITEEYNAIISSDTRDIIAEMIDDHKITLDKLLNECYTNSVIFHNGIEYKYSIKQIQNLISIISESIYGQAPKINNYTFNHTITHKATSTTSVKKLFEGMLSSSNLENLGIEKLPQEKALYLSVIKPAGFHKKIKGKWQLSKPDNMNFEYVWQFLEKELKKKCYVDDIIEKLSKEPFGLNQTTSLFVVSLFILVNQERMHILRDNTYKYILSIDLLMNMWKASKKYELQLIVLTSEETALFKAYATLVPNLVEKEYSKDNVVSIIRILHTNFTSLPEYTKTTHKISKEAKSLRSAIVSMKDPMGAFFILFPKALGYDSIKNISTSEYIQDFKNAFNEIVLSYKKEIIILEEFFAEIFHLENKSFPFGKTLINLTDKLSNINTLDNQTKALLKSFTYANDFIEFIDNISIILIGSKIRNCDDSDIIKLKDKLTISANKILSMLELKDISTETLDVRKVSLDSLNTNLNKIISVNKNQLDKINKKVVEIEAVIPKEYSKDERLFLISQLLNEELINE